ncbi:LLM class flavin-dependent oxidoreductase [Actinomadura sp. 9N407]|uniref:LLM class flavin-dependent oxidoreductase n=1 Tax=Actinomadura sp. 9N407 TaxID=3375154 RepID=UPI0037A59375
MKLGAITEWVADLSDFREQVRLADDLGYDVIGIGDSPARAHEMYVSLTVAAHETRRATLTTMVTTPFLRHPSVTATAISAVREVAGDRLMIALGSGGSAIRVLGRPRGATPAELREYALAVREILAGRSVVFDGRPTEPLRRVVRPMPVFVAADHPASLRMAGEIADGVIMTVGLDAGRVEQKIATVRSAAERAGRDPGAVEVWGFTFVAIGGSRAAANAEIATALASDVGMRLRAPHMRATVPPELLGAVEEVERRYDRYDHVLDGKNARLLRETGLTDFAAGLTAVTGDVAEVADHLKRLETLGVSCVLATLPAVADPAGTLRRLSEAAAYVRPRPPAQTSTTTL